LEDTAGTWAESGFKGPTSARSTVTPHVTPLPYLLSMPAFAARPILWDAKNTMPNSPKIDDTHVLVSGLDTRLFKPTGDCRSCFG